MFLDFTQDNNLYVVINNIRFSLFVFINQFIVTSRRMVCGVFCVPYAFVCLSGTLSTKSTMFGGNYLVHRLSERDEIWQFDRPDLAVLKFQDW